MPCVNCKCADCGGDYEDVELVWPGKNKPMLPRVSYPFQTIEIFNGHPKTKSVKSQPFLMPPTPSEYEQEDEKSWHYDQSGQFLK